MKNSIVLILVLTIICGCSDPLQEINESTLDLAFINAEFSYVLGVDQYGVPTDHWAEGSKMTFFYLSDSESGKPQGRFVWTFEGDERPIKAWWRFDQSKDAISIFGRGGTQGHLFLTDLHREIKNNWRTIHINEEGHLIFNAINQDPIKWEFARIAAAPDWNGE